MLDAESWNCSARFDTPMLVRWACPSSRSSFFGVSTALAIGAFLASLALLFSSREKLKFNSFTSALISIFEIVGLAFTLVSLKWVGLFLLAAVNVVAFLAWGFAQGVRIEKKLTYASLKTESSASDLEDVAGWVRTQPQMKGLRPVVVAELIKLLAERGRSIDEIKAMVVPIGLLQLTHEPDSEWLVDRFDRLLRRADEPASKAMQVADIITNSWQRSASTFEDIIEALVAFYDGPMEEAA
ncbi:MAG TPA: hypothetical protein VK480_03455 [Solirubrobacterales bacterium]|nr:hypothetical protein [Solirubrobacterales bacterium]